LEPVEISKLIDGLCRLATHQKIFYTWRPFLPDADDDLVLELALAANARFVITHNVADFRKAELLGIHAITPAETLRKLLR
jgi:predicted nucleic acid-binding protein